MPRLLAYSTISLYPGRRVGRGQVRRPPHAAGSLRGVRLSSMKVMLYHTVPPHTFCVHIFDPVPCLLVHSSSSSCSVSRMQTSLRRKHRDRVVRRYAFALKPRHLITCKSHTLTIHPSYCAVASPSSSRASKSFATQTNTHHQPIETTLLLTLTITAQLLRHRCRSSALCRCANISLKHHAFTHTLSPAPAPLTAPSHLPCTDQLTSIRYCVQETCNCLCSGSNCFPNHATHSH